MALDAHEIVDNALIDLILDFPIFAQLITRLGVKVVDEPAHKAPAWTDGKAIYINAAMINYLNENPIQVGESGKEYDCHIGKKQMMFLLCHELMHLLLLTFDRAVNVGLPSNGLIPVADRYKADLWNQATDYEINALLLHNEENYDGMVRSACPGEMPALGLYKSEYKDKSAEDIYKELYEKYQQEHKDDNKKFVKNDPNSNGGNGDGDGDYSLGGKSANSGNQSSSGNGRDGLMPLDEHVPILDDATRSDVINKIAEIYGSRSNGLGSSALDRALDKTFQPQPFNWKKALTKYIRGWMKDNYTWNRPSRSGMASGLILPSSGKTPKMHIAVAVDTSGSIYDTELNAMMNHLFTILQQFKDFTIDVWCCGSKVYPETLRTYTASNKKELANFKFVSDGGNDMRKNFEFLREHYKGDKPDVFITMSDFYDPLDGDTTTTSPCPCIWLVLDHPNFTPPSKIKAETYPFVVEKAKNDY